MLLYVRIFLSREDIMVWGNFSILHIITIIAVVPILIGLHYLLKNKSNKDIMQEDSKETKKGKIKVPWYVIGFFIMCALFSLNVISPQVSSLCKFKGK